MLLIVLLSTITLWALYVYVFTAKRFADKQTRVVKYIIYAFVYPTLIIGYFQDIVYNYTVGSLLFWSWPSAGDHTLTARLQRLIKAGPAVGWRYHLAYWICKYLLHPFDDNHCGRLPE